MQYGAGCRAAATAARHRLQSAPGCSRGLAAACRRAAPLTLKVAPSASWWPLTSSPRSGMSSPRASRSMPAAAATRGRADGCRALRCGAATGRGARAARGAPLLLPPAHARGAAWRPGSARKFAVRLNTCMVPEFVRMGDLASRSGDRPRRSTSPQPQTLQVKGAIGCSKADYRTDACHEECGAALSAAADDLPIGAPVPHPAPAPPAARRPPLPEAGSSRITQRLNSAAYWRVRAGEGESRLSDGEGVDRAGGVLARALDPALVADLHLADPQLAARHARAQQLVAAALIAVGGAGHHLV
jgi:hypothetical protein